MRAVAYDRFTEDLDALEVRDMPEPKVTPASVLIEVRAAAVNPVDWKLMAGNLDAIMPVQFPVIPGWDVAGTVIAVGLDTDRKSTRLNSSHVKTSYAVFCLKKDRGAS